MNERNVKVEYFLDFINNDAAIWSIRAIAAVCIITLIIVYVYKHKKLVDEHDKTEGGKNVIH